MMGGRHGLNLFELVLDLVPGDSGRPRSEILALPAGFLQFDRPLEFEMRGQLVEFIQIFHSFFEGL